MLQQDNILDNQPLGSATGTAGCTDITPAISQAVKLAGSQANLTPPLWVEDAGCFLFSDDKAVYAFSDDCLQLWTITPQYKLNGWAVNGSDLYVQDGCVLCQYDINALDQNAATLPETAFNFKTHARWTSQNPGAGLEATVYTGCAGDDLLYSAPVIQFPDSNAPILYVLNGAGTVIPMPANLNVDGSKVYTSQDKPDALNLFLNGPAGQQTLGYLSGGQAVTLTTGDKITFQSKQAPTGNAALWTQLNQIATAQCQPWTKLSLSGFSLSALVTLVADADSTSKLLISMFNSSLTQYTTTLVSQKNGQSFVARARLTTSAVMGSPLPQLLTPPCVIIEMGTVFLFALTTTAGAVQFQKFKMPAAAADVSGDNAWTMFQSQFQAVQTWSASGGTSTPIPFTNDIGMLCLVSAVQAAGEHINAQPSQLPNACGTGAANAIRMILAAGFSMTSAILAVNNACAFTLTQTAQLLQTMGNNNAAVVTALKNAFNPSGQDMAQTLQALGLSENDTATAMKGAGYGASDVIIGLASSFDPKPNYSDNTWGDAAQPIGQALNNAGFTPAEVATGCYALKCASFTPCSLLNQGYPQLSAQDAKTALLAGGYNNGMALWAIADIYHVYLT